MAVDAAIRDQAGILALLCSLADMVGIGLLSAAVLGDAFGS